MADIELTDLTGYAASTYLRVNSGATALEFDALTAADVGLSNVDNTSDSTKNAAVATLTNKTVNLTSNTLSGTTAQFNTALSDNDFATLAGTETLTSKTVNLSSNTLAGTTAQFNSALSDGDFATLAGSETLTNKTVNLTSNSLSGTTAQFNTALSDGDFATLAGSETLTNKTLTNAIHSGTQVGSKVEIGIACSDETTAITTGTAKATFRMPYAMTLTAVRASVTTAPTGSTLIVDINETGTTVLSTKLSIDISEKTSTTAASAAVISDSALADDAEITIDFDQVGSTIAGAGVKVWLIGTRA